MEKPTQLQLWSDEELPEPLQSSPDEEQDGQEEAVVEKGQPLAVQLYLPGCEPE